jgi:hypothetical protein
MTGEKVAVHAQWALYGGEGGRDANRMLACSTGELGAPNFHDAIGRFDPVGPGALPQVTVSYLMPATEPGEGLLAMAIHGRRHQEGEEEQAAGDDGRGWATTSYFCVPYQPLASAAITYRGMHQALRAIRLPAECGPPLPVTMTGPGPGTPAVDGLALQSAALLLTGRPVCVLGAEGVSLAGRLAFIDTVMSLLPYGLRARMAAATWTRPTNRDHKFRLYFSDAERAADPPDHVLHWGYPGLLTPIEDHAHTYLNWLEGMVSQPTAKLAELTEPIRFRPESIQHMLDKIGVASPDNPSLNYSATGLDLLHPALAPPAGADDDAGGPALYDCAEHVRAVDQRAIKSDIGVLMRMAKADDHQRAQYREIIKETELLKRTDGLGRMAGKLYERLIRVAFTVPFNYEGYRQLEDCLGGMSVRPTLQQIIDGVGMADPWVKAIVYWSQRNARRALKDSGRQKLDKWYSSGEVDAVDFIHGLSAQWERPPHARIICEVVLDFLKQRPKDYQPAALRAALSQRGFLAHALQANQIGNASFRADALRQFLSAAYPNGLDQPAIVEILAGDNAAPTSSLLAAVLLLTKPGDARLAWHAYLRGSIRAMELDEQTRGQLTPLLPIPILRRVPEAGHV